MALAGGLVVLVLLSVHLARIQRVRAWPIVLEHVVIAIAVVAVSQGVGVWVRETFA